MATAEDAAAAAAIREQAVAADAAAVLGTPQEPGSPSGNTSGGSLSAAVAGSSPEAATPSVVDLMSYLMKQSDRMNAMMEMMQYDRNSPATSEKSHLANCKLDEKYFRNVGKYSNLKSGWKKWRRQFVRECDADFADMVETFELLEEAIDHINAYTPIQNQLSTNLYNRLIAFTTGTAFHIVESVPCHNGGEAWRLLSKQFDPKTDAHLTNLVLSVIEHKIKGKDVQAGLILWEAQLLS